MLLQFISRMLNEKSPLLAFAIAVLIAISLPAAQSPDALYSELVKKVVSGDSTVDFRALRLACAKAENCDAKGDSKDVIAMRRASGVSDHKAAVEVAEKLIAAGFPNVEAHAICAEAYRALKQADKAKFHHEVTAALIRSILSTGDGKTKETAFEVIGTQEEHIILSVLGLPPFGRQALISGKPHSYDLIEVDDAKTGKKVSVYFNIDAFYPMKGL
ncbi:MAG: DUF4919 domain-containing protein [Acidobacteria bacterium]|nr:DUF4919 domain-containing protein [Acidobacteriota bacterium]